ncbi:MAG: LacI family DNA-binding transcriptional regulator, partial [Lachnospiraceae bacterium]|nr:LacI family DNA-binding transcriptional regulator [Lachnospiraceae bacterium]
MAKDVTLADIAKKVGVSNVAVSKALSGKAGVSEKMRQQIKDVANEMGYIPSVYRRASAETQNIGVIVPEQYYGYSVSFYGKLYEMVVRALYDNKYYGILEILGKKEEKETALPRVMQEGKVDGLIFLGQMAEGYVRKMVEQTNLPVFFLDIYMPSMMLDTVISDGYYGMYMLTNYLITLG